MKENILKLVIYITILALFIAILFDLFTGAYYRAIIWAAFIAIFIILFKIPKIPLFANFCLALLLIVVILGEYFLYNLIPFFDKIVHLVSQIILSFLVLYLSKDKIKDKKMLILFCITTVIAISVIWEVVEYGFDGLVNSRMQGVYFAEGEFFGTYERLYKPVQTEIDDTMTDLIFNILGSLVFAGIYFFKERKRKVKRKDRKK